MKTKLLMVLISIMLTAFSYSQQVIVSAGNSNETFGQVFPIIQTDMTDVEVYLGLPKFEKPVKTYIPKPKAPIKKPNFFQRLFKALL